MTLTEPSDALQMVAALRAVPDAEATVNLAIAYEADSTSSVTVTFQGDPSAAQSVREFLAPQIRAAETKHVLTGEFSLTFPEGLSTAQDTTAALTKKLTLGAPTSATVTATTKRDA